MVINPLWLYYSDNLSTQIYPGCEQNIENKKEGLMLAFEQLIYGLNVTNYYDIEKKLSTLVQKRVP
jgi:hypothetical protein